MLLQYTPLLEWPHTHFHTDTRRPTHSHTDPPDPHTVTQTYTATQSHTQTHPATRTDVADYHTIISLECNKESKEKQIQSLVFLIQDAKEWYVHFVGL